MLPSTPIKEAALRLGFTNVGICSPDPSDVFSHYEKWLAAGFAGSMNYMHRYAEIRKDPRNLLPNVRSVIAVGLNYFQPVEHHSGQVRIARYALGRDYHKVMRGKLSRLARELAAENTGASFRACVDSAPILEREYANRAGLGFYGKNTMLIDIRRGSWFLIGILLTSLEVERDKPSVGECGHCRKCIDACPTGAIVQLDGRWSIDARSCISYLTIEAPQEADERIGDWTFGCDVCQEVCPFNQPRPTQPLRSPVTTESDFLRGSPLSGKTLEAVESLSEEEWSSATQGSPIRRAGYEGLKRSARLNRNREG